jgi:hypothetical protein
LEKVLLENIRNRFNNFRRTRIQPVQLQQLQTELLAESTPDLSYLVLIVGSCAIATFGLLANSAAVISGAMIIAPLMLPKGCTKGFPYYFLESVTRSFVVCT